MSAKPQDLQVWSVEGHVQHLIYSPKGTIEGLMIDSEGAPVQFVVDAHDVAALHSLSSVRPGQLVVIDGTLAPPSPKGDAEHEVYHWEQLVSVDGHDASPPPDRHTLSGTVARLNYARHGAPNGVVLDSGDFIHTKPEGFERLALQVGDAVRAEGPTRPLAGGPAQVMEAHIVNDIRLGDPGHPDAGHPPTEPTHKK